MIRTDPVHCLVGKKDRGQSPGINMGWPVL